MKKTKTKIIATMGPECSSAERITELINAGASIFRINSSHGSQDQHKKSIEIIRSAAMKLGVYIPIILDLQGPKIRVGNLRKPLQLKSGDTIKIAYGLDETADFIPVDYVGIATDVHVGDRIMFNDGRILVEATAIADGKISAKVIDGGELESRKGMNIPGSTMSIPAVTDKDIDYIKFAVENELDYIAQSFVRNSEDVLSAKAQILRFGSDIPLIAKIEKPQAVANLSSILDVVDGVMVARGDLGIELSPEKVPIVQKQIIAAANAAEKIVITATQMLESMIQEAIPTRAEASDVANAIIDGTDVIMLSGETAVGKHPVAAVEMMTSIAQNIEASTIYREAISHQNYIISKKNHKKSHFALDMIRAFDEINISAIVAFTRSAYTAQLLSKARVSVPVLVLCDNENLCRRLNLLWGVFPYVTTLDMSFSDQFIEEADKFLIDKTFLSKSDRIIMTAGLPYLAMGQTNFVRLHELGMS